MRLTLLLASLVGSIALSACTAAAPGGSSLLPPASRLHLMSAGGDADSVGGGLPGPDPGPNARGHRHRTVVRHSGDPVDSVGGGLPHKK